MCKWDGWCRHTLNPILYQVSILANLQCRPLTLGSLDVLLETRLLLQQFCYYGNSLFSSRHPPDFKMLVTLSLKTVKRGHKLKPTYLYANWIIYKIECQGWLEKPLILGRSGTRYVAMVTKVWARIVEHI